MIATPNAPNLNEIKYTSDKLYIKSRIIFNGWDF